MNKQPQSIGSITTGLNKFNTTGQLPTEQLSKEEKNVCDIALGNYADLMHPKFYAWYCKAWYKIGEQRFHELYRIAKADGKQPAKLFSMLIKKELAVHNS